MVTKYSRIVGNRPQNNNVPTIVAVAKHIMGHSRIHRFPTYRPPMLLTVKSPACIPSWR